MTIKFLSSVLYVRDIHASRAFYEGLLDQKVEMDFGPNVGFVGGFAIWQASHAESVVFGKALDRPARLGADNLELYFETDQIEEAWQRLEQAGTPVVHPIYEQPWGQRVFRVYDPDGHMVELGEPMPVVVLRFLGQGLGVSEVSIRTGMPEAIIQQIAEAQEQQKA